MARLAACALALLALAVVAAAADGDKGVRTAAAECLYKYGPEGCRSAPGCDAVGVPNCIQCQRPPGATWTCNICNTGFFLRSDGNCYKCPQGAFCGGYAVQWCDSTKLTEGKTTSSAGQWAPSQCSSCLPGYQPSGSYCSRCPGGTFKAVIGTAACAKCPTGLIPNAQEAATRCINATTTACPGTNNAPSGGPPPTTCKCATNFIVAVTGNAAVFGPPNYNQSAPNPWPISCKAAPPPASSSSSSSSGGSSSGGAGPPPQWGHWSHGKKDGGKHEKYDKKAHMEGHWQWAPKDENDYYGYDDDHHSKHDLKLKHKWEKDLHHRKPEHKGETHDEDYDGVGKYEDFGKEHKEKKHHYYKHYTEVDEYYPEEEDDHSGKHEHHSAPKYYKQEEDEEEYIKRR